jgi:hypothetical protein
MLRPVQVARVAARNASRSKRPRYLPRRPPPPPPPLRDTLLLPRALDARSVEPFWYPEKASGRLPLVELAPALSW